MSDNKKFVQENALEVIEKFGGIRPMANKLGVAVTTVQGWKKRESIPDARIDEILEAANQNDIQLNDEAHRPNIEETIAQIKAKIEQPGDDHDLPDEEKISMEEDDDVLEEDIKEIVTSHDVEELDDENEEEEASDLPLPEDIAFEEPATPLKSENTDVPPAAVIDSQKPAGNSTWLIAVLGGLAVIALAAVFWPVREEVIENREKLAAVQDGLNTLKQEQSTFIGALEGYLPEDMKSQLQEFQKRTADLGEKVGDLTEQTKVIAKSVIGEENAAQIERRLEQLEGQFSGLVSSAQIQSILSRFSVMNDTEEGQTQLDRATNQLYGIIGGLDGRLDLLDEALISARDNSTALGSTFEGVADEDLKAGALLLGLTQFRSALNRGETPFEEDLTLLYSVIGEDNATLRQSLDRLAPQAKSGVLTPKGLSDEFRALAGDIAVNSFKGEDASITEQAKARLSKVLQIKKGGEPLLSNESQETISTVQTQLDSGDLRAAMSTLSQLEGENAEAAQPFMQKLTSTIAAQEVKDAITSMLQTAQSELSLTKPLNLKTLNPTMMEQITPNNVVKDNKSGFTMLPDNKLNHNFKNLNMKPQE